MALATAIEDGQHNAVTQALTNPFVVSLLHDIHDPSGALNADVTELLDDEDSPGVHQGAPA